MAVTGKNLGPNDLVICGATMGPVGLREKIEATACKRTATVCATPTS